MKQSKIMILKQAIERFVHDGDHLCIGGFTLNRNPMAAVYEIIRSKVKNLHVYAHSNGQGIDELIGGGCVSKIEIAYSGIGRFTPTCIRFAKAVEKGSILFEDYSNYQMTLRFMAGAMGLPFLPCKSALGTDIINKWGFSKEMRKKDERLPDDKLIVIDNPFKTSVKISVKKLVKTWAETTKLVLVPAINPDIAIIHVQTADENGAARIEGLTFADIDQAKSAKYLIITCEELVEPDKLKNNSGLNHIPAFCVDAVVHVPYGAYPTACYKRYDYDPEFLTEYEKNAKDDLLYKDYLNRYIYGTVDHKDMLEKVVGVKRLEMIKADADIGYAINLSRNKTRA